MRRTAPAGWRKTSWQRTWPAAARYNSPTPSGWRPISVALECFGTETVPVEQIEMAIATVFDLRPAAIITQLNLRRPIYQQTAAYGHFGRADLDLPWEHIDKVAALKKAVERAM